MIQKLISDIQKQDIDDLVSAKVAERRTLEYKELLRVSSDEEKREFFYDVTSLANAAGGDLIFGVRDQKGPDGKPTGVPEAANGLASPSPLSTEIARLENMLLSSVAPRILGVQFEEVAGFALGPVLIIRIPKSWVGPHMVTFKGVTRFYSRTSAGKYPLDVYELRSAFAMSNTLPERLQLFRNQRLASVVSGETPIVLPTGPKVVVHLVPVTALDATSRVDLTQSHVQGLRMSFRPMHASGWDSRFNFDGFVTFTIHLNNYTQLFRNGAIEAVDATSLDMTLFRQHSPTPVPDFIDLTDFETELIAAVASYMDVQKQLGIVPPIVVAVTMLGVKNYRVTTGPISFGGHDIDRDTLMLPDVVFEDFGAQPELVLRPIFDALAQAAGLPGSPNYKADGSRISKRN